MVSMFQVSNNNLHNHENLQRDRYHDNLQKQITNYTVIDLQIDKPACTSEGEQYRTVWINLIIKMIPFASSTDILYNIVRAMN